MPPPSTEPSKLQAEKPGTETVDTPFEAAEGQEEAAPKPTLSKDSLDEELMQRAAAELPPMTNLGPSGHVWELTEEEASLRDSADTKTMLGLPAPYGLCNSKCYLLPWPPAECQMAWKIPRYGSGLETELPGMLTRLLSHRIPFGKYDWTVRQNVQMLCQAEVRKARSSAPHSDHSPHWEASWYGRESQGHLVDPLARFVPPGRLLEDFYVSEQLLPQFSAARQLVSQLDQRKGASPALTSGHQDLRDVLINLVRGSHDDINGIAPGMRFSVLVYSFSALVNIAANLFISLRMRLTFASASGQSKMLSTEASVCSVLSLSWLLAELSAASCAATWCFPGLRGIQLGLALNVVTSPLLLLLVAAFIRSVKLRLKLLEVGYGKPLGALPERPVWACSFVAA
ncbi:Scn11a [Symbiodinium sp. CCMP2592]|nr:Scn11a [Symbiodinium sp. CCMP2592]